MKKNIILLAFYLVLTGCSTFRSYQNEQKPVLDNLAANNPKEALVKLEKNAPSERDLLFFFEKGEIQRMNQKFSDSISTWTEADHLIDKWENEAKVNLGKAGAAIGSVLLNDKVLKYDGEDYEKVMLSTRQALNYMAAGKQDDAMVEMKKTWEREALIQKIHEKEITESEEEAKKKGYKTESSELKGYPIATLNSPDVLLLKNGYQNAFSQYLSGFIAEASGDAGNAAAGYRAAIELQPGMETPKKSLAELDARLAFKGDMPVVRDEPVSVSNNTTSPHSKKGKFHQEMHDNEVKPAPLASDDRSSLESNVLIVVENGVAPVKGGITIPIPIPTAGLVPIAFPTLETDPLSTIKAENIILPDNTNTKLELIASVEAMAKRSLKDRLPYIMVRAAVRAAIKGATQALAYNQSTLAGAAINLFNAATERPDERIWKTLPSNISIARVRLPEGNQVLKLQTSDGERVINVRVKGKYCVIPIRIIGKSSYVLQES